MTSSSRRADPGTTTSPGKIAAHRQWTGPWLTTGSGGRILHADDAARLLAVEYLPGHLVQDDPGAVAEPDTHHQAGALLAALHDQDRRTSHDHEERADAAALAWLERPHRIAPSTVSRVREAIATHAHRPVEVVPTHGDWHSRNWIVDGARVGVIDLGRAEWRPRWTDLARLARREWLGRPSLEEAFIAGYGWDPRDPALWRATLLREAVGAAAWAYRVGDRAFEDEGHESIARALTLYA